MIVYKDILQKLKEAGYNTTRLRREKIIPESTIDRLRHNKPITTETIDIICNLTKLQVGDLLEYQESEREEEKDFTKIH